jgi:hypothetical protein
MCPALVHCDHGRPNLNSGQRPAHNHQPRRPDGIGVRLLPDRLREFSWFRQPQPTR